MPWRFASKYARFAGLTILLAYGAVSLVALGRWALRRPPPVTTPRIASFGALSAPRERASGADANVGSFRSGATVRASSWDWFRRHHPLFAIDGEPHPTPIEKWASAPADRAPWLEVHLAKPARVSRVVLVLATDPTSPILSGYVVRCLAGGRELARETVSTNRRPEVVHALHCEGADVVRVEMDLGTSAPLDAARIYEIEVWGSL